MKKRLKALALCLTVAVFSALANACQDTQLGELAIIWSALSTEKYMLEQVPDEYTEAALSFAGIKGETQSAQLMITAKQDIKGFNLIVGDLVSSDGKTISKENIKVYAERYVEIYDPYVNTRGPGEYLSEAGFYPDALVPLDKYRIKREDRIKKGQNQGLWIDIEIPKNAEAGRYSGSFTLVLGKENKSYDIPVSLKVYNITMPEEVHAKSCFLIWYDQLAFGEGDNYDSNTNQIYYDYLLSKRLCSGEVNPNYTKDIPTFISHVMELAQNPRVTCYAVPERFLNFNAEKMTTTAPSNPSQAEVDANVASLQKGIEDFLSYALEKNIEYREQHEGSDLDIFAKMMFYFEDEPTIGYRTQRVRVFNEKLKAAKDAVLERYAEEFARYPDLKESIKRLDNITPTNYVNEALFVSSKNGPGEPYEPDYDRCDGVTLWCPEMYKWSEGSFREVVKQRQAYGERFWWYNCVINSPAPSYYVESMPINIRLASWMQYEYGIEGTLYWDVVHWKGIAGGDPYEDVQYNGYGGGEGLLLYPGAKYGQKTPISSIRMEQIRAGQQDYEYFYMLDAHLKAYNQQHNTSYSVVSLIKKMCVNLYVGTMTLETASHRELEDNRIKILEILESFENGDAAAAVSKINAILN